MRPTRHRLAAALAATVIGLLAAFPVLAKEGMEARLDAPIARDTPGGTELLVGMTVSVPEGDIRHPVQGSPIYLRLIAPDGTVTEQLSSQETELGHYVMRIVVPDGGIARVEVVLRGTTDLPLTIVGEPLSAPAAAPAAPAAAAPQTAPGPSPWPVVIAGLALAVIIVALAWRAFEARGRGGVANPDPGGLPGR